MFFPLEIKDSITHRKGRSQKLVGLHQFPIPPAPKSTGEHRSLRWMLHIRDGGQVGTGKKPRPPAQQAANKPPSCPCCPPEWAVRAVRLYVP